MSGVLTSGYIGKPPVPPEHGDFGGGGGRPDWGGARKSTLTGVFALVAASSMTFLSAAAVFVERRAGGVGWPAVPLPGILWINTVVLLASSALLESARALLSQGRRDGFNLCWTAATACGLFFLAGQALAWRQMLAAGFRLEGSPASAFFYLFTALHAAHVVGGVSALIWVDVKALRFELGPARRTAAQATAVFWHFLDCVWICLLLLLAV